MRMSVSLLVAVPVLMLPAAAVRMKMRMLLAFYGFFTPQTM